MPRSLADFAPRPKRAWRSEIDARRPSGVSLTAEPCAFPRMAVWSRREGNSPQRVRDELCRASIAGAVGAPARPLGELYRPRLLDRAGEDLGARPVRRDLSRRCPGDLRRLWRLTRSGAAPCRAGAGQ